MHFQHYSSKEKKSRSDPKIHHLHDKQTETAYSCYGILFANEEEYNTDDVFDDVDELKNIRLSRRSQSQKIMLHDTIGYIWRKGLEEENP